MITSAKNYTKKKTNLNIQNKTNKQRIHSVWFNLYKVPEQAKLIHGDINFIFESGSLAWEWGD